jgi:hypothetical protein
VELQINEAQGTNIGLAELEVFFLPEPAAALQLLAGVVLLQFLARRNVGASLKSGEPFL